MYRRKQRGFTLIEMLIALLIMSVAIALTTFVVGAVKSSRDSTYESVASRVADSKLNELRAGGYAALPASGSFSDPALSSLPQGAASTTVSSWNSKTKQVTTGVSWRGSDGSTRYVSFTTLVTETGGL